MLRSLHTAASGMKVQQVNLDIIANNLSNVNTTAFKKVRGDFQDLFYQTLATPGSNTTTTTATSNGIQVGLGSKMVSTNRSYEQGSLRRTGNPLDLAISGHGFFEISLPDGTLAYSRDGSFTLDQNGNVVTSQGYTLNPQFTIPQNTVSIDIGKDGTVTVDLGDGLPQNVGQIQISNFINPGGLKAMGDNLYQATQVSGDAVPGTPGDPGYGTLEAQFLEISNVDVAEEMVNMILGQRAYEATSRALRTADQILGEINSLKR